MRGGFSSKTPSFSSLKEKCQASKLEVRQAGTDRGCFCSLLGGKTSTRRRMGCGEGAAVVKAWRQEK